MNETFLHYIWRYRLYRPGLQTIDHQEIEVIHPGIINTDGGPDFQDARIRIGKQLWAGHIEIHVRSSDWFLHQHETDPRYQNIVLHVVGIHDQDIYNADGHLIAECVIEQHINDQVYDTFLKWQQDPGPEIACRHWIGDIQINELRLNLYRLAVERLEVSVHQLRDELRWNNQDGESTFYQYLLKGFGLRVNAASFHYLGRITPLMILRRRAEPLDLEALLLGQGGLLEHEPKSSYGKALFEVYHFLKRRYHLMGPTIPAVQFLRLRPGSFPTIRLAQMAHLLEKTPRLYCDSSSASEIQQWSEQLKVGTSEFWDTHYTLDKTSETRPKLLGLQMQQAVMLNSVYPFYFFQYQRFGRHSDMEYILDRMSGEAAEDNHITRLWTTLGLSPRNSLETQALVHLYRHYCIQRRCAECAFGTKILKTCLT